MRIIVLIAAAVFIFSRPGTAPATDPAMAFSAPFTNPITVEPIKG